MRTDSTPDVLPLVASQRECSVVNLRGDAGDPLFTQACERGLGLALPATTRFNADGPNRLVWVGPDDWFSIGMQGTALPTVSSLRSAMSSAHYAVTDVSGGFSLVTLSGPQAADILTSGCPLDLHPDVFKPGMAAGSHFYQAAITLWKIDAEPRFELLVRRSFTDYFWKILAAACGECGLDRQDQI